MGQLTTSQQIRALAVVYGVRKATVDPARLRSRLERLYRDLFASSARIAIADAIADLRGMDSPTSAESVSVVMDNLERKLGVANLGSTLVDQATIVVRDLYASGARAVRSGYKLTVIDRRSIDIIANHETIWIKHHNMADLLPKFRSATIEVMEQGYSRARLGEALAESLGGIVDADEHYWRGLANHTASKAQEIGRITGFEAAGIVRVRVANPSPVSDICKEMVGRTIEVSHLVRQRDRILSADNREDLQAAMILPKAAPPEESMPTGFGIPPYHYNCKTTLLAEVL